MVHERIFASLEKLYLVKSQTQIHVILSYSYKPDVRYVYAQGGL